MTSMIHLLFLNASVVLPTCSSQLCVKDNLVSPSSIITKVKASMQANGCDGCNILRTRMCGVYVSYMIRNLLCVTRISLIPRPWQYSTLTESLGRRLVTGMT